MNTHSNPSETKTAAAERPLPAYCGSVEDQAQYRLTPEQQRERDARMRRSRVASLAFHRIQAQRSAARGDRAGASYHTAEAGMYARVLRAKPRRPDLEATDLRDEIRSWFVMAEVIASEAHITAEQYYWA